MYMLLAFIIDTSTKKSINFKNVVCHIKFHTSQGKDKQVIN